MANHTHYASLILLLVLAVVILLGCYPIGGQKPIVIPTAGPAGPPVRHAVPTQAGAMIEKMDPTPGPVVESTATEPSATQPAYPPPPLETPGYPYP